jgi:hypothetical protein
MGRIPMPLRLEMAVSAPLTCFAGSAWIALVEQEGIDFGADD